MKNAPSGAFFESRILRAFRENPFCSDLVVFDVGLVEGIDPEEHSQIGDFAHFHLEEIPKFVRVSLLELPLDERDALRAVRLGGTLEYRVHEGFQSLSGNVRHDLVQIGRRRNPHVLSGNGSDERERFVARASEIELPDRMEVGGTDRSRGRESGVCPAFVLAEFFSHAFAQKLAVPLPHRLEGVGEKEMVDHVTSRCGSFEKELRSDVCRIRLGVFLARIGDSCSRSFEEGLDVDAEKGEREKPDVRKHAVPSSDFGTHGKRLPSLGFGMAEKLRAGFGNRERTRSVEPATVGHVFVRHGRKRRGFRRRTGFGNRYQSDLGSPLVRLLDRRKHRSGLERIDRIEKEEGFGHIRMGELSEQRFGDGGGSEVRASNTHDYEGFAIRKLVRHRNRGVQIFGGFGKEKRSEIARPGFLGKVFADFGKQTGKRGLIGIGENEGCGFEIETGHALKTEMRKNVRLLYSKFDSVNFGKNFENGSLEILRKATGGRLLPCDLAGLFEMGKRSGRRLRRVVEAIEKRVEIPSESGKESKRRGNVVIERGNVGIRRRIENVGFHALSNGDNRLWTVPDGPKNRSRP